MTRALLLVGLVSAALTALPLSTQQGSISGVILSADADGRPVARAVVTLAGATLRPSLVAVTDAAGRFTFLGLPAGQFTVTATKSSYLPMAYGQTTPGRGAGLPITLAEGQQVTGLSWKLPRGGVISGRVLDDRGQPMRDAPIVLMQYRQTEDGRSLDAVPGARPLTDSSGTYRATGILPGEYFVSALPPGGYVYLPEPFVPGGPEARQVSTAELQWALRELKGPSGATEPAPGPNVTYTRMFFPGTPHGVDATPVVLAVGDERRGIDISMRLLRSARIEGRVVGPDGQPVERPRVSMSGSSVQAPGNAFVRRNLPPGKYTITAHGARDTLFGRVTIDLNGEDVLGVEIKLAPSATVSGRVTFESASGQAPIDASNVRLSLRPNRSSLIQVPAAANGTFTLAGPEPGRYRLHAAVAAAPGAPAGGGWVLKSAMLNGRDVTDEPFDIGAGEQISGVVVTLTDRPTELSGVLQDTTGQPAPGFYVVVFPTDPKHWIQGSRRLPVPARAASDGAFRFAGLPAGVYHLAAVTVIDQADLSDTAFLRELSRAAVTVTVIDGERTTQNLRFGKF
jgi:hypothetical protein